MNVQHLNRQMRGGGGIRETVKTLLLACFILAFFTLPAQGQATPTPIPLDACGLPSQPAVLTEATAQKTFNLTDDCWPPITSGIWIFIQSGEFTINGNGHLIIAAPGELTNVIRLDGANAVLNLNNIRICCGGNWANSRDDIDIRNGTFNARDVTFSGNVSRTVLSVSGTNTRVNLTNVFFWGNRSPTRIADRGLALNIWGAGIVVTLNDAYFEENAGQPFLIRVNLATLRLIGTISYWGNLDNIDALRDPTGDPMTFLSLRDDGSANLDDSRARYCIEGVCPPTSRKRKEPTPSPTPTSTPRPQFAATHVALQSATGATFRTAFGLDSGVYFRQLDGAGIGVQSIIDAGFLEAFDVYGYVEQGVEVCFPQIGRVVFLDANTSPRTIVALDSTVANGQTCVSINSPGSLVLLPE